MRINLQDSSFIVSYIQMFLKEYSGINIKKIVSSKSEGVYTNDSYIISMNNPIRVTGIYDTDTYMAAALYMAFNYPNEQFPTIWNLNTSSNIWSNTPYQPTKLTDTMDKLIKACCDLTNGTRRVDETVLAESRSEGQPDDIIIYTELLDDPMLYLSWSELLKYFSSEGLVNPLYDFLTDKTYDYKDQIVPDTGTFNREDLNNRLVNVIVNNVLISATRKNVVELDERILSYFFGEVVSPLSTKEEIYRIQKLMYNTIPLERIGKFDAQMTEDVKRYQDELLQGYTREDSSEVIVDLPTIYSGFKVTGYVDPWTERVIKERGVL